MVQGINYEGMKKRQTFDEVVEYLENKQARIKYPYRPSIAIRNSHRFSNLLDGEGDSFYDAEQMDKKNAYIVNAINNLNNRPRGFVNYVRDPLNIQQYDMTSLESLGTSRAASIVGGQETPRPTSRVQGTPQPSSSSRSTESQHINILEVGEPALQTTTRDEYIDTITDAEREQEQTEEERKETIGRFLPREAYMEEISRFRDAEVIPAQEISQPSDAEVIPAQEMGEGLHFYLSKLEEAYKGNILSIELSGKYINLKNELKNDINKETNSKYLLDVKMLYLKFNRESKASSSKDNLSLKKKRSVSIKARREDIRSISVIVEPKRSQSEGAEHKPIRSQSRGARLRSLSKKSIDDNAPVIVPERIADYEEKEKRSRGRPSGSKDLEKRSPKKAAKPKDQT